MLYESALRILKEKSNGKKLPTLKMLQEEKTLNKIADFPMGKT